MLCFGRSEVFQKPSFVFFVSLLATGCCCRGGGSQLFPRLSPTQPGAWSSRLDTTLVNGGRSPLLWMVTLGWGQAYPHPLCPLLARCFVSLVLRIRLLLVWWFCFLGCHCVLLYDLLCLYVASYPQKKTCVIYAERTLCNVSLSVATGLHTTPPTLG